MTSSTKSEFDLNEILNKIRIIEGDLKYQFLEREEIIETIFASLISGQHFLMIGPPGTAKSEMIHAIANRITNTNYFSVLLTEFSTPQEIFGPYSFVGLKEDKLVRKTDNFLPAADVAFVDEIFKASSAILNTLLTIINERTFYDNGRAIHVPLLSLFAASNEYPNETDNVSALYDRFLFRFPVDYIASEKVFKQLLVNTFKDAVKEDEASLTLQEINFLRSISRKINIPDATLHNYSLLRKNMQEENIRLSDRRYIWSLDVLRVFAMLSGETEVKEKHFINLLPMFWEKEAEIPVVKNLLEEHVNITKHQIERSIKIADSILSKFSPKMTMTARMQLFKKLGTIVKDLEDLNDKEASKIADSLKEQLKKIISEQQAEGQDRTKINSVNLWGEG